MQFAIKILRGSSIFSGPPDIGTWEDEVQWEQWDTLELAEQRKKELEKQRARVTIYKII